MKGIFKKIILVISLPFIYLWYALVITLILVVLTWVVVFICCIPEVL